MIPPTQAFPEAAASVLCVCQHAELGVSLAGHHPAHPAQPAAGDPARGVPQTPWASLSTGTAWKAHTNTRTLGLKFFFPYFSLWSPSLLI